MKLLIDTSLPKMLIILVNNDKNVYTFSSDIQKKADLLPTAFQDMLNDTGIKTSDITEYYVTQGPGSFMGARTALTFVRTISQVNGAKLFVANTLEFIGANSDKDIYLDAKSNQSFMFNQKTKETKLVDFQEDTIIDYDDIISNTTNYLKVFKEIKPSEAKPLYFKEPKIGGN